MKTIGSSKTRIYTTITLIILISTLLITTPTEINAQSAGWYNPNWQYRRAITINNTVAQTLTNYTVLVVVNTATLISQGKLQNTCADLRFTDSDGTTLLSYWIESGCNTANTRVWVRVPSIPASSTKTIYMYYGNPTAPPASNGYETFPFFDDFTTLRGGWAFIPQQNALWGVSNGWMYLKRDGAGNGGTIYWQYPINLSISGNVGVRVISYAYVEANPGNAVYEIFISFPTLTDLQNYANMIFRTGNSLWNDQRWALCTGVGKTVTNTYVSSNTYYHVMLAVTGSSQKLYINNTLLASRTDTLSTTQIYFRLIWGGADAYYYAYYFDYVVYTYYVEPEPTVTVSSTEEVVPPNPPTLQNPPNNFRFDPQSSVNFSWVYNPVFGGDYQTAFQLQISNRSDFTILFYDSGKVSTSNTYTVITLPENMSVGLYYWRVRVWNPYDIISDWSSSRAIIVDKVVVTLSVNDTRTDVGSFVNVSWVLRFKSDNTVVSGFTINVSRNGVVWYSGSASYALDTSYMVTSYTYTTAYVRDNTFGITAFETNSVSVVYDKIIINSITPTRPRFTVGDTAEFNISAIYAFDNTPFQGSFIFNDTLTKSVVGRYNYEVVSVNDSLYGLTRFEGNYTVSVIFDKLVIDEWFVKAVNKDGTEVSISNGTRVDYRTSVKPYVRLKHVYDGLEVTSGNVSLFGLPATYVGQYWVVTVNTTAVGLSTYNLITSAQSNDTTVRFVDLPPRFTVVWDGLVVTLVGVDVVREVGTVRLTYASDNVVTDGFVRFEGVNTTTVPTVNGLANISVRFIGTNITSPHTAYGIPDSSGLVWSPYQNASVPLYMVVLDGIRIKANNPITLLRYLRMDELIHIKYDVRGDTAVNLIPTYLLVNGRLQPIVVEEGHVVLRGLSSVVDMYYIMFTSSKIIEVSYASAPGFDIEVGLANSHNVSYASFKAGVLINSTALTSVVFINSTSLKSEYFTYPSPPVNVMLCYYCESETTFVLYVGFIYMVGESTKLDTTYLRATNTTCPVTLYPYVYAPSQPVYVERYGNTLGTVFRLMSVGDVKVHIVGPVIPGSLLKYVYVSSPLAVEYSLTDVLIYPYGTKGVTLRGFRGWSLSYSVAGVTISGITVTSNEYVVDVPVGIVLMISVDPVGRAISLVSASPPPAVTTVLPPTVTQSITLPNFTIYRPSVPQVTSVMMYGVFLALTVAIYSLTKSLSTAIVISGIVSSIYAFATKDLSILPYTAIALVLGVAFYVSSKE